MSKITTDLCLAVLVDTFGSTIPIQYSIGLTIWARRPLDIPSFWNKITSETDRRCHCLINGQHSIHCSSVTDWKSHSHSNLVQTSLPRVSDKVLAIHAINHPQHTVHSSMGIGLCKVWSGGNLFKLYCSKATSHVWEFRIRRSTCNTV